MGIHDPSVLPEGLERPVDDGGAVHLMHMRLPEIALSSTGGGEVRLDDAGALGGRAVLFFYPRTGIPGQAPSVGFGGETWESIPGARGCTPQSCGFGALWGEYARLGVRIFGVSTNTREHQREFKARSGIGFEFLSDAELKLTRAMRLATFAFPVESGGPNELLKRMAWYVERDACGVMRIRKVWYPVFPPDQNAGVVLEWLRKRARVEVRRVEDWGGESASASAYVQRELERNWLSTEIWSRGKAFAADRLMAFVAKVDGAWAGHVTLAFEEDGAEKGSCEVITLAAGGHGGGVGSRLLERAEDEARARGMKRVYLTTTNDNVRALGFYQRRGWRMAALYKGMMDRCREMGKPVALVGESGIAVRDEIELELGLE
ncbi:MAG TPA: GNAT family N-acetyltransferase [Phycisphaerales bacterium]|nr:GNAT family N-acetyltransferase [Phycisphaerales bacterium]